MKLETSLPTVAMINEDVKGSVEDPSRDHPSAFLFCSYEIPGARRCPWMRKRIDGCKGQRGPFCATGNAVREPFRDGMMEAGGSDGSLSKTV